jgi:hypothetical protein
MPFASLCSRTCLHTWHLHLWLYSIRKFHQQCTYFVQALVLETRIAVDIVTVPLLLIPQVPDLILSSNIGVLT